MLRQLFTMSEVKAAPETFIGSYDNLWRLQRTKGFSGRTTSGTDTLSQTTFVSDDIGEIAAEILRVVARRPKVVCTNKDGPTADIVAALNAVGVYYDHDTKQISGQPIPSNEPVVLSPSERLALLTAEEMAENERKVAREAQRAEIAESVKVQADALMEQAKLLLASVAPPIVPPVLPAPAPQETPVDEDRVQVRAIGNNGDKRKAG